MRTYKLSILVTPICIKKNDKEIFFQINIDSIYQFIYIFCFYCIFFPYLSQQHLEDAALDQNAIPHIHYMISDYGMTTHID